MTTTRFVFPNCLNVNVPVMRESCKPRPFVVLKVALNLWLYSDQDINPLFDTIRIVVCRGKNGDFGGLD